MNIFTKIKDLWNEEMEFMNFIDDLHTENPFRK